jgi:hypothetical protein
MKLRFTLFSILTFLSLSSVSGQILIPNTTPVTQNFDAIGATTTATLPSGFRVNTTPNYTTGTLATTVAYGSSGAGIVSSTSAAGVVNWANGVTATSTDRAVGFLTSGTFSSPRSIILAIQNTNAITVMTDLTITFDYEKYRSGTRQFDLSFFHGATPGLINTAAITGDQSFIADANNTTVFNPPTTISKTVTLTGLNISPSSIYYLCWTYTGLAGATNAQGIGIDNVVVTAGFSSGCTTPVSQSSTIGVTNITTTGADFSWLNAGSSTGTMVVIRPTIQANTLPVSGTTYTGSTIWATAGQIDTNNRVIYRGNASSVSGITGLTPGTQYTATVYSYNDPGSCYNVTSPESFDFYTLANEPTSQIGTYSCGAVSSSQINLTFAAPSTVGAAGFLILYREGATPTGLPVDGQSYLSGAIIGDTTVLGQTALASNTSYNATGLNGGTVYYFLIVAYNSNGAIGATYNYRTLPIIPNTNCNTNTAPEINIKGVIASNPSILDGSLVPSGLNNTLFATVVVGGSQSKVFRIENTGNAILTISSLTFVGGNAGDFAFSGITFPLNIASGTFQDFTITFTPLATGVRNTTVTINNNDSSESVYDFVIQGNGTVVALVDINVKGNGNSIADNSLFPTGTNWTAFGVANVGLTTVTRTFTIENIGSTSLSLTGTPLVTITGPNAASFSVTIQPSTGSIAGGSSVTFDVVFNPTSPGSKNATINILSNDPDENPYNFNINGNAKGASNIYAFGNGNDIVKGATTTSLTNNTNFGGVAVATGIKQNTFVITNLSGISVYISNLTISGVDASMFTIVSNPTNNALSTGNSTSFTINFTPSSVGIKNASITFSVWTNSLLTIPDPVDPTYNFAISGLGENFTACSKGAPQIIAMQDFEIAPATPTWNYGLTNDGTVTIAGGTYNNGSVPKNAFIGAQSFQFKSIANNSIKTAVLNLNPIDASQYTDVNFSMKVGAFRTGSTQGLDVSDYIQIETSIDGGINWSTESVLRGYSDSRWDFNATGIFNAYYTGTNNGANIDTRLGASELSAGIATYNVKNLPNSSNLLIRITLVVNRLDEIWAIDNIKIEGQIPVSTTWRGPVLLWTAGVPTTSTKAIIDANYNAVTNGNIQTCECQINSGKIVNISPNNFLEIQSNLSNEGILNIENNGSLVQVNDSAINKGAGSINVTRNTTPYQKFDYTYWSSPIANLTIGATALSAWRMDYAYDFETVNFQDLYSGIGYPQTLLGSDSHDDNDDDWHHIGLTSPMIPAKGYAIMAPTSGVFPATSIITFSGETNKINNGIITIPIALSQNNADNNDDFNLVGNPYPSAISANDFINANLPNITGTLSFWTHKDDISVLNLGPGLYNFSNDDYAYYNLTGGTATGITIGSPSNSGSTPPTGFIASGQGFAVDAQNNNTSLIFNNQMRNKGYSNTNFWRQAINQTDRIWLNLTNPDGLFSQQLIGYFDNTTLNYDQGYDSVFIDKKNYINFYSIEGEKYKIQARSNFVQDDIVQLGYTSAVTGSFTIAIDNKEGILNDVSTEIYLKDNDLNIYHDLKNSPYNFSTVFGTYDNRFEIHYTNPTLVNTPYTIKSNTVFISSKNDKTIIKSSLMKINKIFIYDILGRELLSKTNLNDFEFSTTNLQWSKQALIVKVVLENGEIETKKIVN